MTTKRHITSILEAHMALSRGERLYWGNLSSEFGDGLYLPGLKPDINMWSQAEWNEWIFNNDHYPNRGVYFWEECDGTTEAASEASSQSKCND